MFFISNLLKNNESCTFICKANRNSLNLLKKRRK
jgi:hypothetical protein